jgi:phosphatidate cytidylyltransferase
MGGLFFAAIVLVVAAIALWEWTAVTRSDDPAWLRAGALAALIAGLAAVAFEVDWIPLGVAALVLLTLSAGFFHRSAAWIGFGVVYVSVPCTGFMLLRQAEPWGLAAVVFVLMVVWATDIGAFFGGRAIGGPKLWPRVSPKKTWSGALSGVVAAMAAGGVTIALAGAGRVAAAGVALAIPLSIACQAGDLLESAVKRRFGAKDSGHVIPGHGGVLDRVDGLFGAAALAWLIAALGLGDGILVIPGSAT